MISSPPVAPVRWRHLATAAVVTAAVLALGPRAVLGFDALMHLVWGRELASGAWEGYDLRTAVTPHPLQLLLAVLLAPLGDAGPELWRVLHVAALGALAAAGVELGRRLAGAGVGVLAAALLVTQPFVLDPAARGQADVPALALVAWAAVLETGRPRRGAPVLVLLALAGLLRPEAWLLAGAYLLWTRRPALLPLALVGPVVWALTDLALTGDPLWSLSFTGDLTERIERPTGLEAVLPVGADGLVRVLGPATPVVGAVGLLLARRLPRPALPVALVVLGSTGFLVLAVAELSLQPRYLLPAVLGLVLLAALVALRAPQRWLRRAAVLALVLGQVAQVPVLAQAAGLLRVDDRSVHAVLEEPTVRDGCGPVVASTAYLVPHVALALDLPARDVPIAPARGLWLGPSPTARTTIGGGVRGVSREVVPPPSGPVVLDSEHWRVVDGC